jgi:protein-S-isoprenylcysteine O-methyltransferase Ste14
MRIASLVGFLLMVTAVVGLVFTHALFSHSPVVVAVQVAAVALMVWARLTFGRRSFHPAADVTGGGLVTTGPYRFIRHPIYAAACVFCWAGVLANGAVLPFAAGMLLLIGAVIRIFAEERLLSDRYPGYRNYAKGTKRMVPYLF